MQLVKLEHQWDHTISNIQLPNSAEFFGDVGATTGTLELKPCTRAILALTQSPSLIQQVGLTHSDTCRDVSVDLPDFGILKVSRTYKNPKFDPANMISCWGGYPHKTTHPVTVWPIVGASNSVRLRVVSHPMIVFLRVYYADW